MQKITFAREMGFTREEFDRILPAALNQREFDRSASGIKLPVDGGTMQLVISEQKYRKIASISLPYLDIEFIFEGLSNAQVEETMRYFDLRYQRGGG
jgi:hypothetical protein